LPTDFRASVAGLGPISALTRMSVAMGKNTTTHIQLNPRDSSSGMGTKS
jgi:hypothetical protein